MRSMNFTSQEETQLFYTPNAFDFFELMKPRVMSLVVFTTLVGMYMSPYQIHPVLSSISLLSIAFIAIPKSPITLIVSAKRYVPFLSLNSGMV